MRRAVIDVGSNSVLLLVAEHADGGWKTILETSEVTSLGEGTKQTGVLSEGGMERTLAALARAYDRAHDLGASSVLAGATMAARIAKNAREFLDRAVAQDTPVFILTGEEEAQLGFLAVADDPVFADQERISIVDVGGQSTELVTAERTSEGWNTLYRHSFPVGTLGLRGTVFENESPGPAEMLQAVEDLDDLIKSDYQRIPSGVAVALGATGTNLVTIREKMTEWDPIKVHAAWLDFGEVSEAVGMLMPMTDVQRGQVIGMEPGRERTIHIGCFILERFLHAIKARGCAVSVRGWRHALLENGLPQQMR